MSTDVVEAVVRVHGGAKFYRGAARAARAYVERDRSRADDYYLAEGSGVAERLVATPDGVSHVGGMDGDAYEHWVAGLDVDTGRKKGRVREDANALRFVEVTINGRGSTDQTILLRTLCGLTGFTHHLTCANAPLHTLKRNSTTSPSCMT